MWIDEKIFYKVFKEHPDWFTNWVDEGRQIWNRQTGEIICEDGTLMNDLVYRPPRDYNNYWKDCFNDEPKVYEGGSDTYKMTLSCDDYVKDPESFLTKAKDIDNQAYVNLDSLKPYKVTVSVEDEEEEEEDFRDKRVSPSDFKTGTVYEVRPYNRGGIYKDIRFLSIDRYCPTVNFDDNYTDDWYAVWSSEKGIDKDGHVKKIYDNSTLEDCLDFIYNYFYVLERDNV